MRFQLLRQYSLFPRLQMPADFLQRLMRIPPWSEPIRTIQKIGLKDRFQD